MSDPSEERKDIQRKIKTLQQKIEILQGQEKAAETQLTFSMTAVEAAAIVTLIEFFQGMNYEAMLIGDRLYAISEFVGQHLFNASSLLITQAGSQDVELEKIATPFLEFNLATWKVEFSDLDN